MSDLKRKGHNIYDINLCDKSITIRDVSWCINDDIDNDIDANNNNDIETTTSEKENENSNNNKMFILMGNEDKGMLTTMKDLLDTSVSQSFFIILYYGMLLRNEA